jgi:dipeptidyl aminopeptidase/acylaminoacyl peptidase
MSKPPLRHIPRALGAAFVVLALWAAPGAQTKRPLTHDDYDAWRTIPSAALSPDGKFLAYAWMPYEADGEVVVRELPSGREHRHGVGLLPPPPIVNPDELEPGQEPPSSRVRLAFTSDSKYLVANTYPNKADVDRAKREKKRPDEMPRQGLLAIDLATGAATRVERVKSFQVPEHGGPWVAYLKEAEPDAKPAAKPAETPRPGDADDEDQPASASFAHGGATSGDRKEYGTELVVRDLARGDAGQRTVPNVLSYAFAKDGKSLAYAVSSKKEEENGVYAIVPGVDAPPQALLSGRGKYQKLAWDRPSQQLAFFSDRDDVATRPVPARDATADAAKSEATPEPAQRTATPAQGANRREPPTISKVYYWDRKAASAVEVVSSSTPGFPKEMIVSDKGVLAFSRDGKRLLIPAGAPPKPELDEKDLPPADERVVADLWHWQDDFVQPMQKVQANRERNRTYTGVWHLAEKRYVQLAGPELQSVALSDEGTKALGMDSRSYRRMVDYDGTYNDVYVVDTRTGERRLAVKQLRGGGPFGVGSSWAPDGRHAVFFRDGNWHLLDVASLAVRNLTERLPVTFADEEDDTPDPATSYGQAVWLKDGKSVLLNDRYDVWQAFVDGPAPRMITAGAGREKRIQYRIQRISRPGEEEDEARYVDPASPVFLRAEDERTRATGFYKTTIGASARPEQLLWGDEAYQVRGQAKNAEVVLIAASRFDRFPDLHVADFSFRSPRKVTDGDAQRAPFNWGTAELVDFRNVDGVPLQAALYKPANFDPVKKYPMLVYIYERLSQGVHGFVNPAPGSSSINISYYVSNGYLVLTPDIVYTVGAPGQSALKCVLPAVDAVVAKGFVDEKAVGIQGHSWGGYQIAYMVTQTSRFRAAEAGAPVGNMTSAYSGIRWGSGNPRQFQYEQTQSRIGRTLYDAPLTFLENSPVFHVRNVRTPLLLMHNDQDDAVPWYQGVELFLALRRFGKEAYLFNYNGEFHGLRRRHDQRDWAVRMQQFFDHHLKGAPKPEWMEKGIPYIDREEEKYRRQKPGTDR